MSRQPLRAFQKGERGSKTAGYWLVRRAGIFIGTAALTSAGCYEMYEVVQVGGVHRLEWMVLILFVILFAWIAFSFMSAFGRLRGAAIPEPRIRLASILLRRCRPIAKQECDAAADLQ